MTSTATNRDERIVCKSKKKKKKKTKTKRKRNDIYADDDYDNESINKVVHATATAASIDIEMTLVHKKMNQKRTKRKKKKQKQRGEKYFSVSTVVVSRDTSVGSSSSNNKNECSELVVKQCCTKKKKSKKKNKRSKNINDDEDPNRKSSTSIPAASQEEKSLHEKKRKSTESDSSPNNNNNNKCSTGNRNDGNKNNNNLTDTITAKGKNDKKKTKTVGAISNDDGGTSSTTDHASIVRVHVPIRRLSNLCNNRCKRKNEKSCDMIVPGASSGMATTNSRDDGVHKKRRMSDSNSFSTCTVVDPQNSSHIQRKKTIPMSQAVRKCTTTTTTTTTIIPDSGLIARHRRIRLQSLQTTMQTTKIEPEVAPRIVSSLCATVIGIKQNDTTTESNAAINDADDTDDNTKFPFDDSVPTQPSQKKQRVLGPEYTKKNCENWEKKFQLLVEYKKANNGSTLVPMKSETHPGLGNWVHYQRQLYITDMLSTGRKDRLESIRFVWKVRIAVPWIEMYQRLVAYQEQYGTTLVPKTYKADLALGRWVQKLRGSCKEEDRRQLLEDIDFVWDARRIRKKY